MFASRRAVPLGKGLKQPSLLLLGHANAGILDRNLKLYPFACAAYVLNINDNLAAFRKLDGVIDQICQYLP